MNLFSFSLFTLIVLFAGSLSASDNVSPETLQAILAEAKAGDVEAQFFLADYYRKKENKEQRIFWLRQAAIRDDEQAQRMLGVMHYEKKEFIQAATWLKQAANGGDALAQYILGTMYANGDGVGFNLKEGLAWCYLAESLTVGESVHEEIANMIKRMEKDLGPEVSAEAKKIAGDRSVEHLRNAAKRFVEMKEGKVKLIPVE